MAIFLSKCHSSFDISFYLIILLLKDFVISSHTSQLENIDKNISQNLTHYNETKVLRQSRSLPQKQYNNENYKQNLDSIQNISASIDQIERKQLWEQIYGKNAMDEMTRREQMDQITLWLSDGDNMMFTNETPYIQENIESIVSKNRNIEKVNDEQNKSEDFGNAEALKAEKLKNQQQQQISQESHQKQIQTQSSHLQSHKTEAEEDNGTENPNNDEDNGPSGTTKTPPCAHYGRYYCSYKEDYPIKVVTEVTKYYKWPLEKLFRDLRHQVMPTLANDNTGGLVCDSITRIIRAGWAKNTNGRWLVVINTDYYQQYITEIICRHGSGSYCNFIPPCFHASCRQRYNTQKLLVIDPWNPYKGPFLSEFLFPSCCVCYIPADQHDSTHSASNTIKDNFIAIHPNHQTLSGKVSSSSHIEASSLSPV